MGTEGAFKTSLWQAVSKNYVEAIRGLVSEGVADGYSINVHLTRSGEKGYFRTALHEAVRMSAPETAAVLLELGANVTALDTIDRTPLHVALYWIESTKNRLPIVEMLLERGAPVHLMDRDSETPLHRTMISHAQLVGKGRMGAMRNGLATDADMLRITRLLIQAGADPDFVPENAKSRYRTPFQRAVEYGLVGQVRLFVEECGVDWTQKTLSKKSMTHIAGTDEMKALLLSYKAGEAIMGALGGVNDQRAGVRLASRALAP